MFCLKEVRTKLYAVVLHPHIEVKTADARAVIQPMIPLKLAITQTGNLGGFIAGLYTNDYELIGGVINSDKMISTGHKDSYEIDISIIKELKND